MALKKRTRNLLIALVVVIVLAGALAALVLLVPKTPEENTSSGTQSYELYRQSTAAVDHVDIENTLDSFTVKTTGTNAWTIEGLEQFTMRDDFLEAVITNAAAPKASEKVGDDITDLSQYGLDNPSGKATAYFTDGTSQTFEIGGQVPGENKYYVRLAGENTVYVISNSYMTYFLKAQTDFVSAQITPTSESGITIQDATFSGTCRPAPIVLGRATDEEVEADPTLKYNVYRVTSPHEGGVDFDRGGKFIQYVNGMMGEGVAAIKPTAEDMAQYGLDNPYSIVEYSTIDGQSVKLSFGKTDAGEAEGIRYVYREGVPLIYTVNASDVAWAEVTEQEMISPLYFSPGIDDIAEIHVVSGGQDYAFVLAEGDDDGMNITCNGEKVDTENFRKLLNLMISLPAEEVADITDASQATGDELMSLTYRLKESDYDVKISLIDAGNRRAYISKNGEVTYTTRSTYADKFATELQKFLNGEEVASNF